MLLRLVSLGLVQAGVDPKRPDQIALDTQMLEQYLKRYRSPRDDRDRRAGRCREPERDLDAGIGEAPSSIWTPGLRDLRWPSCVERRKNRRSSSYRRPMKVAMPETAIDDHRRNGFGRSTVRSTVTIQPIFSFHLRNLPTGHCLTT